MLDYIALFLLFFTAFMLFYGIIAMHDIPYEIAKRRNHPHQDAIHVAGWVSLFTLHLIWPFLWIWATLYRSDRGWGFASSEKTELAQLNDLQQQVAVLTERLNQIDAKQQAGKED